MEHERPGTAFSGTGNLDFRCGDSKMNRRDPLDRLKDRLNQVWTWNARVIYSGKSVKGGPP